MLAIFLWFNPSTFYCNPRELFKLVFLHFLYLVQMLSMVVVYALLVVEYAPTDALVTQNPYWRVYGRQFSDLIVPRKNSLLKLSAHLEILNLVVVLGSIIRFQRNFIHLLVFTQYLTSQYLALARHEPGCPVLGYNLFLDFG